MGTTPWSWVAGFQPLPAYSGAVPPPSLVEVTVEGRIRCGLPRMVRTGRDGCPRAPRDDRVRFMTYNILTGGVDDDGGRRLDLICEVIRAVNPDVVAIQEANEFDLRWHRRRFEVERDTGLRSMLGLSPGGFHGALLLKPELQITYWRAHSPATNHILVEASVSTPQGTQLTIGGVHLDPVSADARLMGAWHATAAPPSLVMGDFNNCRGDDPDTDEAWPRFEVRQRARSTNLGPTVDDRALRAMEAAGYVDLYRKANPGKTGATVPSVGIRIDYIFATAGLADQMTHCQVYAEAGAASDHLPVFADIDIP